MSFLNAKHVLFKQKNRLCKGNGFVNELLRYLKIVFEINITWKEAWFVPFCICNRLIL
jgi:hypothetical protein